MNARKVLVSVSALLATTLTSCGTLNRMGEDTMMVVGCPAFIPYAAATDGYTSAKNVREGMGGFSMIEVLALPITFTYHFFEHSVYTLVHAVDLFPCVGVYWLAEIHPHGPEIRPMNIYTTYFDEWADKRRSSTDAETGEMVPAGK